VLRHGDYWDLCASERLIHDFDEMAPAYPALGRADITVETLKADHLAFVDLAMQQF
jgi:hypothetical protein